MEIQLLAQSLVDAGYHPMRELRRNCVKRLAPIANLRAGYHLARIAVTRKAAEGRLRADQQTKSLPHMESAA
jgi:hypothetical protein